MQATGANFVAPSCRIPSFISPLNTSVCARHISTPQATSKADATCLEFNGLFVLYHFLATTMLTAPHFLHHAAVNKLQCIQNITIF